jgi:hypothetical protein
MGRGYPGSRQAGWAFGLTELCWLERRMFAALEQGQLFVSGRRREKVGSQPPLAQVEA